MVAGLPGADRRYIVEAMIAISPLTVFYKRAYGLQTFDVCPGLESGEYYSYETSICGLKIADIITIIEDLIDEKL